MGDAIGAQRISEEPDGSWRSLVTLRRAKMSSAEICGSKWNSVDLGDALWSFAEHGEGLLSSLEPSKLVTLDRAIRAQRNHRISSELFGVR